MKTHSILNLRPTQFVLGIKEVEAKIKKLTTCSRKERKLYIRDHVIPVVKAADRQLYLIDHHHFARTCWELGIKDFEIAIVKDFSHLTEKMFWRKMIRREWTYLRDQFGDGPRSPMDLPTDIRCMADDPYRSLAWAMVSRDVVEKAPIPFFEFKWAEYFRKHLRVSLHSKSDFETAIQQAIKLSQDPRAKRLPGFKPNQTPSQKKTR